MNYFEALQYLRQLGNEVRPAQFSLQKILLLCRALGNPEGKFSSILIAGTNGKGSTAAILYSILLQAGIPVGLYTSPHLISPRERIRINRSCISEDEFAAGLSEVKEKVAYLTAKGRLGFSPTFFEVLTAAAFLHFARSGIRLAVLEVGMGGRLDAVNVCRPLAVALTGISLDHQRFLGNSLISIAREKTGIFRRGVPAVIGHLQPRILHWVSRRAAQMGTPIQILSQVSKQRLIEVRKSRFLFALHTKCFRYDRLEPSLCGYHQMSNTGIAILLAENLAEQGWPVEPQHIVRGVSGAFWPGRMQLWDGDPPLLLDGAHNRESATNLASFLQAHFFSKNLTIIFGAMRDKDIPVMVRTLFPLADQVILTCPKNSRAAAPEELLSIGKAQYGGNLTVAPSIRQALEMARHDSNQDSLVVVTGSLYLVGEALAELNWDPTQPIPELDSQPAAGLYG